MRISDSSSDVCSSDLALLEAGLAEPGMHHADDLGALLVDCRRVEIVDGDIRIRPHRMRQRPGILGELAGAQDRKSGGSGKGVAVRVELGGRRIIKKNKT